MPIRGNDSTQLIIDPPLYEPAKVPRFYVSRTLLGGGDRNRRTIYERGEDGSMATERIVLVMNQEMREWTDWHKQCLETIMEALRTAFPE